MKKRLLFALGAFLLAGTVTQAAPVSPEQAKAKAEAFMKRSSVQGKMRKSGKVNADLTLAHSEKIAKGDQDAIYVFNRGTDAGYVLVAADDRIPEVIGYSVSGSFDPARMPVNMQSMIESWNNQIAWLIEHPDARTLAPQKPDRAIEPLLGEIKWDQGDPYNRQCPVVTQYNQLGDSNGTGPAATGCVATALGQIMYYHKWPETGSGSVSYTSKGSDDTVQVSVDFEGYSYAWDKMLPSLAKNSDAEAIDAVSTLLYHVGAAFESVYGASTGATDVSVAPALKKYFGYDAGVSYLRREFYTEEEWAGKILNEFENGRPIAYGGVTQKKEGHFFVLDGVDTEGYYHVNWGWSGLEDGYYRLTLLEPGSQGIGGAESGNAFHYAQNMIIGIQKPVEGSKEQINFASDYITSFSKTVSRQGTASLKANEVWNSSATPVKANLGFVLVNEAGEIVYRQWVKQEVEYGVEHGESVLSCAFLIPDNIEAGTYTVRPAYQVEADGYADHLIQIPTGRVSYYTAVVTDKNIVYSTNGAYNLTMVDVVPDTDGIKSGVRTKFTVKLHNDGGEFYGPVQLRVFIDGKDKVFGKTDFPKKPVWVSIPEGDSELEFEEKLEVPGSSNYVFRLWGNEGLFDEDGYRQSAKNLCSKKGFTIEGPALPPVLSLADDMIATTAVGGVVPKNDLCVKAYIENEGGPWTGKLRMEVWHPDSWRAPDAYVEFDEVSIDGECEQWVTLTGGVFPDNIQVGQEYELCLVDPVENEAMVPSYYNALEVTVGEPVEKIANLSLQEIWFAPEQVVAGVPTSVQFDVTNTGYNYNGPISFVVKKGDQEVHVSASQNVSIPRDESVLVDFTETFELPTADDYVLTLLDGEKNEIGSREGLLFTADAPVLAVESLVANPDPVEAGKTNELTYTLKNTGFRYDGHVRFTILEGETGLFESQEVPVELARGEEGDAIFTETLPDIKTGEYLFRLLDDAGSTVGESTLHVSNGTGIAGVGCADGLYVTREYAVAEGALRILVFSADGSQVAAADGEKVSVMALPAGSYVARAIFADRAMSVKFVR